jgi:hypothetical protein
LVFRVGRAACRRPQQRQNPDRSGGEIGDAELAHERQSAVAINVEYLGRTRA